MMMKSKILSGVLFAAALFLTTSLTGQDLIPALQMASRPPSTRIRDSVAMIQLPPLPFPEKFRNRSLPAVVDNSLNAFWGGIRDQQWFYTCEQTSGVGYVFSYEINRLRNLNGWNDENRYPPHYTWNFMNEGGRYVGVNFLQSFEAIRQQGHMNSVHYGADTAMSYFGWVSGYDKYLSGMGNRIRKIYAIRVNNLDGINQLRNYLYDHLDGSSTGGLACFTTSSGTFYSMSTIPDGTPEAGRDLILSWWPDPVHALTLVGYNDSIRFDVNQDGKYTNHLDINGDGINDVRDWEIGAFKIANSYGGWWSNEGFVYALYSSFAAGYPYGGIWNDMVNVIEVDTGYYPKLTVKVTLTHNLRNRIRVLAGISRDTAQQMPEEVLDFPIFNFQGGEHTMQGMDEDPQSKTIEFGLDVTPLLNLAEPGRPVRYFFMVEEQDAGHQGEGMINKVSFISYTNGIEEFKVPAEDIEIKDNGLTVSSVVALISWPKVHISTDSLPPWNPGAAWSVQMEAVGGTPPYHWAVARDYLRQPAQLSMPPMTGSSIYSYSQYKSWVPVALPFSFPFGGKVYDTIFINHFGFITFEPHFLPEPYVTDELHMLRLYGLIAPAFSPHYNVQTTSGDGIWYTAGAQQASIRWHLSVAPYYTSSVNDFALILYPDGHFVFRYGTMDNRNFTQKAFSGLSEGDGINHQINVHWDANELSGTTVVYRPPVIPAGLKMADEGLLTITNADTTRIYDLDIRVTDAGRIIDTRRFSLSDGLLIRDQLVSAGTDRLIPGKPAMIDLTLINQGSKPIEAIQLVLRTRETLLTLTDTLQYVERLEPGQTLTFPQAFALMPSTALENNYTSLLTIHAATPLQNWEREITYRVSAPVVVMHTPLIDDGDNGLLEPGEVAELMVPVENTGGLASENLHLELMAPDSCQVLSDTNIEIPLLDPRSQCENRFLIRASRFLKSGDTDTLKFRLTDQQGNVKTMNEVIRFGKKPVAIVNFAASPASMRAMAAALDTLHTGYDTLTSLPADYSLYTSVFVILGSSFQGSHTLTIDEANSLTGYLSRKGNLYMEGYSTWYYLNKTPLHPWFKYTTAKIPVYYFAETTGSAGTFSDSLSFFCMQPLNYAIFSFVPVAPAYATFITPDTVARPLQIAYDGNDYKTIGTFLEFATMQGVDEKSTAKTLMEKYLRFFQVTINGPYAYFHAGQTTACIMRDLMFTDDSYDQIQSRTWEFEGGEPAVSHDQNPVVRYSQPGRYDVKLTVSDGTRSRSILKKDYIHVETCAGTDDNDLAGDYLLYPNPAGGQTWLSVRTGGCGLADLAIFDLTGRKMQGRKVPVSGNPCIIPVSLEGLAAGLYILKIHHGDRCLSRKIIVR